MVVAIGVERAMTTADVAALAACHVVLASNATPLQSARFATQE